MSPRRDLKDNLLFEAVKNGQEWAFDQLYREYFAALTFLAYRVVQETRAAEDIVQDSYVIFWKLRNRLSNIQELKPYLFGIVRNQAKQYLRRSRKLHLPHNSDVEAAIDQEIIRAEIFRELLDHVERLPYSLRLIIKQYYLEGKSYAEIAGKMGIEIESVRKQKYRALVALKMSKVSLS